MLGGAVITEVGKQQHACKQPRQNVGVGHIYYLCMLANKFVMKFRTEKPVSGHAELLRELKLVSLVQRQGRYLDP